MPSNDVVIVGGGVIGLSIAYVLAREGVGATVLDRRELGREASWAGAGLIPPRHRAAPAHPDRRAPVVERRALPRVVGRAPRGDGHRQRLSRGPAASTSPGRPTRTNDLRAAAGRWRSEGIAYERLAPGDFGRVEPALNPELRVAYFLPDRAQIRNPRHLRALASAVERRGVDAAAGSGRSLGFESRRGSRDVA